MKNQTIKRQNFDASNAVRISINSAAAKTAPAVPLSAIMAHTETAHPALNPACLAVVEKRGCMRYVETTDEAFVVALWGVAGFEYCCSSLDVPEEEGGIYKVSIEVDSERQFKAIFKRAQAICAACHAAGVA